MSLLAVIEGPRVLPMVALDHVDHAVPLAEALASAGINAIAIALRGPGVEGIARIRADLPMLTIGAAGITRASQIDTARGVGAQFLLAPGFTPELMRASARAGFAVIPGVATLSEMMQAREHGFGAQMLYPAGLCGGPALLRTVRTLMPDLMFVAAGGVMETNLDDYLTLPNVAAVAGSWIVPHPVLDAEDWHTVTELARRAVFVAQRPPRVM